MLDIRFIRENIDLIRENLRRRRDDKKLEEFEQLLKLDERTRDLKKKIQDFRTQRNRLSREIGDLKKSGKDDSELVKKVNDVNDKISATESEAALLEQELRKIQMSIPNILHESVPYGVGEEDNVVVKEWGDKPDFSFDVQSHVDLLETLNVGDIPRAARLAGSRF